MLAEAWRKLRGAVYGWLIESNDYIEGQSQRKYQGNRLRADQLDQQGRPRYWRVTKLGSWHLEAIHR